MLKLCRVTKVKVLFLVLIYVFNFNLFEFSAPILEKGLFQFPVFVNADGCFVAVGYGCMFPRTRTSCKIFFFYVRCSGLIKQFFYNNSIVNSLNNSAVLSVYLYKSTLTSASSTSILTKTTSGNFSTNFCNKKM